MSAAAAAAYSARIYAERARAERAQAMAYADAVARTADVGLDQLARVDACVARAAEAVAVAAATANVARVAGDRDAAVAAWVAQLEVEDAANRAAAAAEDARQILWDVAR